jgi:hypothetical protein
MAFLWLVDTCNTLELSNHSSLGSGINIARLSKKTGFNLDDLGNLFPQKMAAPSFGFACPAALSLVDPYPSIVPAVQGKRPLINAHR